MNVFCLDMLGFLMPGQLLLNVYYYTCTLCVQYRVFTLDPVNFALPKMTEFVNYLHNKSMQYGMLPNGFALHILCDCGF